MTTFTLPKVTTRITQGLLSLTLYFFASNKATGQKVDFIQENDSSVTININGNYFSTFRSDKSLPKQILYPILDAKQRRVTRGFPFEAIPGERADHPHQYGLWMNFGDVNNIDFWNNGKFPGAAVRKSEHVYGSIEISSPVSLDENKRQLSYEALWEGPESNLLLEETTLIFGGNDSTREVTRISRLTALRDVEFGDSKEGFFAIRLRRELESPSEIKDRYVEDTAGTISETRKYDDTIPVTGLYINSETDSGKSVWGKSAKWVTLQGKVDYEPLVITIFDHPDNYGYPARWMARDYGLFGVNPFGEKSYGGDHEETKTLKKGASLVFIYKIILSAFSPDKNYIDKLYQDFSTTKNVSDVQQMHDSK